MKRKQITVTICACVMLIAAGTVGFSFLYQAFFHPEMIIEDGRGNPSEWQMAQEQYEKEILYPIPSWLETGIMIETDVEYLLSDFYHISPDIYSSVFELAGLADLDWADLENAVITTYDFQTGTIEYEEYGLRQMFHITQIQSSNDDLIIAVDKNTMPILCQYGVNQSDAMNGSVISQSSAAPDELPTELYDYLAQMDTVLGQESFYLSFMRAIGNGLTSIKEAERLPGSFAEYCKYGEWKIYSNPETAAYVCIVNDYNFILYYDRVNNKFCGYSIALNHLE